uniref:fimbrial protein n=1 Tax=Prevotella sp. TaxID=59823 RepID=UPI0040263595
MRRFHIYIGFIVWLLTSLFAVSCNDELEGNGYTPNSSSNLHVLVPTVLSANGNDFSGSSSEGPTYNATVDECQINDLRLYAFPVDNNGKANGTAIVEQLTAPIASNMLDEHIATYQLRINPGKYHIYAVANMAEALSEANISKENDLKSVVLNYTDGITANLPIATNIPMIYEPKDINGDLLTTEIHAAGDKYTTVAANLKFTCVKVKLNLLFDPAAEGSAFNGKSYSIKDILAQKLSPSTTLSWDGAFSKSSSNVSTNYAKGFESEVYATSSEASNKGGYYKEGEWTEEDANANENDKDIITLVPGANPTAAPPQNPAAKWLFQGTYYLPERYIAEASQQSTLKVNGSVNSSIANNYTIKLGHRQDESPTSTEVPTFPRGTYYEIIGKIKSLGNATLDCNVSVKDWTPREIDADFNHTTLWVSKTKASVTSTTTDFIDYKSNVRLTKADFGCDNKVGEKDVIVTKLDAVNCRITFNINENIKFSEYNNDNYQGTAKVWIKAGNIKKYLNVDYDASPYFEVNPQEVTIYWDSDNNTKVVQFKTNLGGLAFTGNTSSTVGNSNIQASCDNSDTPEGTFKIVATSNPVTTTVHYLTVQPKESVEGFDFVKRIKVTVKPAMGNYRINFRAINDRSYYSSDNTTGNYEGTPKEDTEKPYNGTSGNTNWADGWFEYTWHKDDRIYIPQQNNHCIYVYTQIGETTGTEANSKVWKFTENWPGDKMVADYTNAGWYYKDFSKDAQSKYTAFGATGTRTIKPGETLVMFSNNYNNDKGYSLHRCPHHLEPGIPLFDYEDREGWIVYDPTSDPTWNIYDEMPTIENINFTIYTQFQTYGWFKVYGIAQLKNNSSDREQFTIFDKNNKSWSCTNVGNGWYKTVITLKAVKGDHEKDIRIMKDKQISDDNSILLFNGNSYEKYNDTGYYDGTSWYADKPSGVD